MTPRPLYSWGRANSIHCTGGRVEPRAGLEVSEKRTFYVHCPGQRYNLCVCPPVYIIMYAKPYTLSYMPTCIPYCVCLPVYIIMYAKPVYLIVNAHRYTLLFMPTGKHYRLCPPAYIVVYAQRYTIPCMPAGIPYRVCPLVYISCMSTGIP